jgi:undecaprenyl-diphosphatase
MKKRKILTILITLLAIFVLLILSLNSPNIQKTDNGISNFVLKNQNETLFNFSKIIGVIFDTLPMIFISLITSLALLLKSRKKEAQCLAITTLITGGLIFLIKKLIERPRPLFELVKETSASFPSGHTTIAVVFFGLLIFLISVHAKTKSQKKTFSIASIFMIVVISLSRLYLNVHWFSDIIGGAVLGSSIVLASIYFYKKH